MRFASIPDGRQGALDERHDSRLASGCLAWAPEQRELLPNGAQLRACRPELVEGRPHLPVDRAEPLAAGRAAGDELQQRERALPLPGPGIELRGPRLELGRETAAGPYPAAPVAPSQP